MNDDVLHPEEDAPLSAAAIFAHDLDHRDDVEAAAAAKMSEWNFDPDPDGDARESEKHCSCGTILQNEDAECIDCGEPRLIGGREAAEASFEHMMNLRREEALLAAAGLENLPSESST